MSGNPCDDPFICLTCGREINENETYVYDGEIFCSDECVDTYCEDK